MQVEDINLQLDLQLDELSKEQKEIAEVIGIDAYISLTQHFGGNTIYIAKLEDLMNRIARDRRIVEEYTGVNVKELSQKYGLTEVWVRNIVKDKRMEILREPIVGQMCLFSDF